MVLCWRHMGILWYIPLWWVKHSIMWEIHLILGGLRAWSVAIRYFFSDHSSAALLFRTMPVELFYIPHSINSSYKSPRFIGQALTCSSCLTVASYPLCYVGDTWEYCDIDHCGEWIIVREIHGNTEWTILYCRRLASSGTNLSGPALHLHIREISSKHVDLGWELLWAAITVNTF